MICSVGWLGAVAAFLALAVAGLTTWELHTLWALYVAMDLIGWSVIVPLCLASLVAGVIQALGTPGVVPAPGGPTSVW